MLDTATLHTYFERCTGITTDSRRVAPGDLYVALRGDRFDGNQYAAAALERGARYAVVDDAAVVKNGKYLLVEDGLTALQQLANSYRDRFYIPVIGLTGSNGKTTTKELIAAVLGSVYKTHATAGNLNNHIGVPLTLLRMPRGTEVAVVEMGANHVGEIAELCTIAEPTHGLITNIGAAHLEGFGGIEGVKRGKSELYRWLECTKGMAFVNTRLEHLSELVQGVEWTLPYGEPDTSREYHVEFLEANPYVHCRFFDHEERPVDIRSQLIGAYNFANIEAAVVLGRYFKVPAQRIKQAIESYRPENNRSQIVERGDHFIILDAYNANPTSMSNALDNLARTRPGTTKIAVLGDMLEMGDFARDEHQRIVDRALVLGIDRIYLVGAEFQRTNRSEGVLAFETTEKLRQYWEQNSPPGGTLLVKGSRGIGLEKLWD